jgi:hypothetical protein
MQMTAVDRVLLLITCILAAYQVAIGIDGLSTLPTVAYTIAFGVLLIASLLLIILGFDVLDSPAVVIAATVIPLALSLGLVWQFMDAWRSAYLAFCIIGFLTVVVTRLIRTQSKLPTIVLAVVHGVAGMMIFLLPIYLAFTGGTAPAFFLVGVGGALIGIGGLLLSFLKAGKPILARQTIYKILPGLLLLTTTCFVLGFMYG